MREIHPHILQKPQDWGYIGGDGVTRTESTTYTASTSEATAETISNAVAKATTNSSNWTLSSGWNETTSLTEEWCEQHGVTREEAETVCRSDSKNWNVSNSVYGSSTATSTSSSSDGWTNQVKVNANTANSTTSGSKLTGELSTSTTDTKSSGWNIGGNLGYSAGSAGGVQGGIEGGYHRDKSTSTTTGSKIGGEVSVSGTASNSRGFEASGSQTHMGESSKSSSSTSGWNNTASYGGSTTTSKSNTVSTAVSDLVSQKKGYGYSYARSGSETQGLATSKSTTETDSYSSAITYNTATSESVTSTWTTAATKSGYHRWVVAGTAHVFGVVGYDIKTKSYFVYTYSVVDDETYEFEDYSYTTKDYNDNENGVIDFEVPYEEVVAAVSQRTYASDGFKVDLATGTIVNYEGTDTLVIIPEFYDAGNGDIVKITGISSNAFSGRKDIVTIILSDYVTEIPDRAFEGCASLVFVSGKGVTSIGDRAFANCPKMEECGVFSQITHLGDGVFAGSDNLYVNAANKDVAEAALSSGVKNLSLNLRFLDDDKDVLKGATLNAPSSMLVFELNGASHKDGEYKGSPRLFDGLNIASEAKLTVLNDLELMGTVVSNSAETVFNKVTVTNDAPFPVKIASDEVTLNQSNITSSGIPLALLGGTTEIGLRGTAIVSSNNEFALLAKNIVLYETANDVVGKLFVPQKALVCGSVRGAELLDCGQIETIDQQTFDNMLNPYKLNFDADGGTCGEGSRYVYNGTAIGDLPIPMRDYYTFNGWYLDGVDEPMTAESVLPVAGSQTLKAKWTENPASDWVKASDLPEGAQVLNTKWTYNLSVYKQVVASYTYYRWCTYYDNMWCQDSCKVNGNSQYHEITLPNLLGLYSKQFDDKGGKKGQIRGPYGSCSHKREGQSFWWLKSTNYKSVLDRVENKESTTKPSGSNISNVVEWVQYRSKNSTPLSAASI